MQIANTHIQHNLTKETRKWQQFMQQVKEKVQLQKYG